jgi:hypothetical protein
MEINVASKSAQYSAKFYLAYQAGSQAYTEWRNVFIMAGSSGNVRHEQPIFDRYTKGSTYPCWYDPGSPTTVVLERGYSIFVVLLVLLSTVVLVLPFLPLNWLRNNIRY